MSMDWKTLPYNHATRWEKNVDSIMSPGDKVTWPQFIAEMVVFFRTRVLKDYASVTKGKEWYRTIQRDVRGLNQQATVICNYFPHPCDEPLVVYAVKKFFREHKPLGIGGFRKTRVSNKGGREQITISQTEKDVVLGINAELMKAVKTRESYNLATLPVTEKKKGPATFDTGVLATPPKKGTLAYLLALEKELKSKEAVDDSK